MSGDRTDLPWDRRLDGETETAYAAFCVYRDLGQGQRSLSATQSATGRRASRNIEQWSSRWRWSDRVAAYDAHLEALTLAETEEETRRLAVEHARARVRLQREFLDRVFDAERGAAADLYAIATCADLEARFDGPDGKLKLEGLIKGGPRVSAWKELIRGANLKPIVGDEAGDLDEDARRRIVEDELARLLMALPDSERLMLAGLLKKAWDLLAKERGDGD